MRVTRIAWSLLIATGLAAALSACGSGAASLATDVHRDVRLGERLIESRPVAAATRFATAGASIEQMKLLYSSHPITEEMVETDEIGGLPRALFEARLAASRQVLDEPDLLSAAISMTPPPRRGLRRRVWQVDGRPVDRLIAALKATDRAVPDALTAHGPRVEETVEPPPKLPGIARDRAALQRTWDGLRGTPAGDEWLAKVLGTRESPLRPGDLFVWARAQHRGRPWQALAARLLDEEDPAGADKALDHALERSLLEGLSAPMVGSEWLPARLARTLLRAGRGTDAALLVGRYAAGLSRVYGTPDNGISDMPAKARTLAPIALSLGEPVALAHLDRVLNTDLLGALRRRMRQPGAEHAKATQRAVARLDALDATDRSDPILVAARSMRPAAAARMAVFVREQNAAVGKALMRDARKDDGRLGPVDRISLALALALWSPAQAETEMGRALDAAAELPDPWTRIDALIDIEKVRAALDVDLGPGMRAGLARVLFASEGG